MQAIGSLVSLIHGQGNIVKRSANRCAAIITADFVVNLEYAIVIERPRVH
jgi:hypothetical protein